MSGLLDVLNPPVVIPPASARRHSMDDPLKPEEATMPRGVYERKPRGAKVAEGKPKRKYARRKSPAPDLKATALEAYTGTAENLARTVRETVDMDDAPQLASALRAFEVCSKLYANVK